MSEPSTPPTPASPAPTLNYAQPPRPVGGVPFIGQMAIGFGSFVVALGLGVLSTSIIGPSLAPNSNAGVIAFLSMSFGLPLLAVVGVTIVAWRRWRWRGYLAGVLTALGLLLLAIGACFGIFFYSFGSRAF